MNREQMEAGLDALAEDCAFARDGIVAATGHARASISAITLLMLDGCNHISDLARASEDDAIEKWVRDVRRAIGRIPKP